VCLNFIFLSFGKLAKRVGECPIQFRVPLSRYYGEFHGESTVGPCGGLKLINASEKHRNDAVENLNPGFIAVIEYLMPVSDAGKL